MILRLLRKHKKFIKYCIIGASGVLLDFFIFYLLNKKLSLHYQFANIISVSCGITNNFLLNVFFNFKTKNKLLIRFIIFYAVGVIGILISALLLYIFVDRLFFDVITTKIIILGIVTVVQYTLNKTFSFRRL